MIFESQAVRDKFHRLSTAFQHELERSAQALARQGFFLVIEDVRDGLEVIIRVRI